ncbi:MAG: Gfo/Idh/MocA family oxidoreductase [Clostridiales bacterium]|nr:Gfo/Idh/MocA family oxidoreductase [Clostridiales bacterium]
MELLMIGGSGHFGYALEGAQARGDVRIAAMAPGTDGEDLSALEDALAACGMAPRVYQSAQAMLSAERADVAVINPWYCDNARWAIECLRRGLHVYSEKPLATEVRQLNALDAAWRASGRALGGMFDLRCAPWFRAIESAVAAGAIGAVRMIHGRKSYKLGERGPLYRRRDRYGGMLPWVGVHAIDLILALGGPCDGVMAAQSDRGNRGHGELEMSAATILRLSGGAIGTVTADYLRPGGAPRHDDDRLMVTGDLGFLEAADGVAYIEDAGPRRPLPLPDRQPPLLRFLNAIGTPDAADQAEQALAASRAALAARRAGDEKRYVQISSTWEG